MRNSPRHLPTRLIITAFLTALVGSLALADNVDLLDKYPTKLSAGDATPQRARMWSFNPTDIYRLSSFKFQVGDDLKVELGAADVGIGHCPDGAVWAVIVPREAGKLKSHAAAAEEPVAHVWLRFHPGEITHLFPKKTVFSDEARKLSARMHAVAATKMRSSWQAGGRAMIPEPKDLTVDVDTEGGPRRFFMVDTAAHKAQYVNAFESQAVKLPPLPTLSQ